VAGLARSFPQERLRPRPFGARPVQGAARSGRAVDIATDGRRALELAEANEYDLILMDMQMPELDGPDAARLIRALPHRQRVPIVALSADVLQEDRDRCLAAGMNDFLAKPVRPEALYSTVLRWLRG
jgi:two-component system sensor histidine kinase/response regulator